MSKREKLLEKLRAETISADELVTLLKQLGYSRRQRGTSHQHWSLDGKTVTLSPHGKDLKRYQIKQAKLVILGE